MQNTREVLGEQYTLDCLVSRKHLDNFTENNITEILDFSLYGQDVNNVCFPNVTKIRESSFSTSKITIINDESFPSVTTIGRFCFKNCNSLTTVSLSNDIMYDSECFEGEGKLRDVTIKTSKELPGLMFKECGKLIYVYITSTYNVASLRYNLFSDCHNLMCCAFNSSVVFTTSTTSNYYQFSNTPLFYGRGVLYVPDSQLDDYITNYPSFRVKGLSLYDGVNVGSISDSFSEILEAEEDGTYQEKYSLHDTKVIEFLGEPVEMEIIAFDKDDLADGSGKAHITWLATHCLISQAKMNLSDTPKLPWGSCNLRTYLRNELSNTSLDLQLAIKEVNKSFFDSVDKTTKTVVDTVFIPSCRELGLNEYGYENQGATYGLSKNNSGRSFSYKSSNDRCAYLTRTQGGNTFSPEGQYLYVNSSASLSSANNPSYHILQGFCT